MAALDPDQGLDDEGSACLLMLREHWDTPRKDAAALFSHCNI